MGSSFLLCNKKHMGDAILSRVVVDEETGLAQVRRVVEHAEVLAANHFMACLPCPGHHDESNHDDGVAKMGGTLKTKTWSGTTDLSASWLCTPCATAIAPSMPCASW